MGDEKGKGRANDPQDSSHQDNKATAQGPSEASFFSRVKSSAVGLASSTFSAPNSDELNHGRAALLAGSTKSTQAGTSSSSSWAESSHSIGQTFGSEVSRPSGFRNEVGDQIFDFSSFLEGDSFDFSQNDSLPPKQRLGDDLFAPTQDAFLRDSMNVAWSKAEREQKRNAYLTVREQEGMDGDDVLAILRNPSAMDEDLESYPNADDLSTHLTPEQISKIKSITSNLFPRIHTHIAPPADHPLNLYPDLDTSVARATSQLQLDTNNDDLYASLSQSNDAEEARRTLMQQWEGVLTGYTDEVWGDLSPLVKEARQEVETMNEEGSYIQPKALRRLGLILNHLQK